MGEKKMGASYTIRSQSSVHLSLVYKITIVTDIIFI